MVKAILIHGTSSRFNEWSAPANWIGKAVPKSGIGLDVTIDTTTSQENLGSATNPFVVHDITPALGLLPSIYVTGFLQAQDVTNVTLHTAYVTSGGTGNPTATGSVRILNNATDSVFDIVGTGARVEIGKSITGSSFDFSTGVSWYSAWAHHATLILDKPPAHSMSNPIVLPPPIPPLGAPPIGFSLRIELGGLHFDHADFIPTAPGSSTGDLRLTNHGVTVYDMTHISGRSLGSSSSYDLARVGTFTIGHDAATGKDYVAYSHAPDVA